VKGNGFSFGIVRAGRSTGTPDPAAPQSIKNAWAAGFAHVDAYLFPCPTCGNAAGQVQATVNALRSGGANFGQLWLDIEGSQYWMGQSANRQFFNDLVSAAKGAGVSLGVYTSESQWVPIMGSFTAGSRYTFCLLAIVLDSQVLTPFPKFSALVRALRRLDLLQVRKISNVPRPTCWVPFLFHFYR
jgi:hypothetical protein